MNIVTGVGFAVPAYVSLQMMQGKNPEKEVMEKVRPKPPAPAPLLRRRRPGPPLAPGSVPVPRKLTERGARQMVPVYWIVFSGLLVLEQFGLLPIMIGNSLYALIKGAALFYMWEGPGSSQVFGLLKPFVETKKD